MTNRHPFMDANDTNEMVLEKLHNIVWEFPEKNFADSAKSLFRKLCSVDPHSRYTAYDALSHPWITGRLSE